MFGYDVPGRRLLVFGGDTGGRYFKFGFTDTDQFKANKGVAFNIVLMVEKFKENYRNLNLTFTPLFGKTMQALVDGHKTIVRIMEFEKVSTTRKTAACVLSTTQLKPMFLKSILGMQLGANGFKRNPP